MVVYSFVILMIIDYFCVLAYYVLLLYLFSDLVFFLLQLLRCKQDIKKKLHIIEELKS